LGGAVSGRDGHGQQSGQLAVWAGQPNPQAIAACSRAGDDILASSGETGALLGLVDGIFHIPGGELGAVVKQNALLDFKGPLQRILLGVAFAQQALQLKIAVYLKEPLINQRKQIKIVLGFRQIRV
jgi:hypothetical protein